LYQLELEVFWQLRSSESENEEVDMPKKQHSEEQIIGTLKQYEAGAKTGEICRKLGISQDTFYLRKRQYAGLGVQELHGLRQLREENSRLKQIVADLTLDRQILQGSYQKAMKPRQRSRLARWVQETYKLYGISERRAARIVGVAWSSMCYRSRKPLQEALRTRLRELAATHAHG
jgi:putative transposase